jgi:creatinine amidohydrolase
LTAVVESLIPHGFYRFFVLNGHGGNDAPNEISLRMCKARHRNCQFGHIAYYRLLTTEYESMMKGPLRGMDHASEAETSLVMHLRPELVRTELLRNDGLSPEPAMRGMIHFFDEATEDGSFGYSTYATAETGRALFETAVELVTRQINILAEGYVLKSISE